MYSTALSWQCERPWLLKRSSETSVRGTVALKSRDVGSEQGAVSLDVSVIVTLLVLRVCQNSLGREQLI